MREKEGSKAKGRVHIFETVPRNDVALCRRQPKDIGPDVCIALGFDIVERPAAPNWVKDEAEWPLLRQGCVHLAEAVCVAARAQVLTTTYWLTSECVVGRGWLARTGA